MSASRFYAALTALLFLAASAWAGAAVFGRVAAGAAPERPAAQEGAELRGIVLRYERALPAGALPPETEDGARLNAEESGFGSGLYFTGSDGYEYLDPADAEELTPARLEALLASRPEKPGEAHFVTGRAFYFAARLEGGAAPAAGERLRLRFAALERPLEALVVSAAAADGETALLLRLTEGEELLGRERFLTAELAE